MTKHLGCFTMYLNYKYLCFGFWIENLRKNMHFSATLQMYEHCLFVLIQFDQNSKFVQDLRTHLAKQTSEKIWLSAVCLLTLLCIYMASITLLLLLLLVLIQPLTEAIKSKYILLPWPKTPAGQNFESVITHLWKLLSIAHTPIHSMSGMSSDSNNKYLLSLSPFMRLRQTNMLILKSWRPRVWKNKHTQKMQNVPADTQGKCAFDLLREPSYGHWWKLHLTFLYV